MLRSLTYFLFGNPDRKYETHYTLPGNVCGSFREAFTYDGYRHWQGTFRLRFIRDLLSDPAYSATTLLRLTQYYYARGYLLLSKAGRLNLWDRLRLRFYRKLERVCSRLNYVLNAGVEVSPLADIEPGLFIHHCQGLIIGGDTKIGKNCHLFKNVLFGEKEGKYPILRDNVTVYAGAVIAGAIVVGENAVIGPNSVVIHDVPDNTIVPGVPAKPIGKNTFIHQTVDGVPLRVPLDPRELSPS